MLGDVTMHDASTTVAVLREFFADDHKHAAVVVEHGVLLAVIDRSDVTPDHPADALADDIGTVTSRAVGRDADLEGVRLELVATRRRRMAVVADDGTFLGLLCLKRTLDGFCSDDDVRNRRCGT